MTRSVRPKVAPKAEVHVGDIVRRLRKSRHFSVRMLADKCGFSPASFPKSNYARPRRPLHRPKNRVRTRCHLGEFFSYGGPRPPPSFVPMPARSSKANGLAQELRRSAFNKDSRFEPMVITIQPGGASGHKPYAREAEQLAMVLQGSLELTLEDEVHLLKRGMKVGILRAAVIVGRIPAGSRRRCCSSLHTAPTSPHTCHSARHAV